MILINQMYFTNSIKIAKSIMHEKINRFCIMICTLLATGMKISLKNMTSVFLFANNHTFEVSITQTICYTTNLSSGCVIKECQLLHCSFWYVFCCKMFFYIAWVRIYDIWSKIISSIKSLSFILSLMFCIFGYS